MHMMLYGAQTGVEIAKLDNGFVLLWEKEHTGYEASDNLFVPRGVEILKTKDNLLKRLGELL